ncbi:MAG: hypothetical protein ACK5IP_21590 [Paracoccus sp. (in: a-proteobacteria)]
MKQDRDPPFGLRLPPDLKAWVKIKAQTESRSQNNLITHLIRQAKEAENAQA